MIWVFFLYDELQDGEQHWVKLERYDMEEYGRDVCVICLKIGDTYMPPPPVYAELPLPLQLGTLPDEDIYQEAKNRLKRAFVRWLTGVQWQRDVNEFCGRKRWDSGQ